MIGTAVVGASGYAGAELVALLARHPETRLRALVADASAGQRWEELHPARAHLARGLLARFDPAALAGLDVVFLALPAGASAPAAAALAGRVGHVVDLGGDLRPSRAAEATTGRASAAAPLPPAVYGLPELFPDDLKGARLVACAGCYATAAQIAAAPALALAGVDAAAVTVCGISGASGAGRKGELELSFSEVAPTLRPYRVGRHAHASEIAAGLARLAARDVAVTFVPHLAPLVRGLVATVVLRARRDLEPAALLAAYRAHYAGRALVRVVDPAVRLPQASDVAGTSFCDVAPVADAAGSLVVLAALDNLLKGAAAQAVQVMNLVFGLDEALGLLPAAPATPAEGTAHV